MKKTCTKCGKKFKPDKWHPHQKFCSKECWGKKYYDENKEKLKEYNEKWREDNKKERKIYCKDYHQKNKERDNERNRKYYQNHKKEHRNRKLKFLYNITLKKYNQLLEQQNRRCVICGKQTEKNLHVDHDHKTGEIRGLICGSCNSMLGYAKDNSLILFKAIKYI